MQNSQKPLGNRRTALTLFALKMTRKAPLALVFVMVMALTVVGTPAAQAGYGYGRVHDVASDFVAAGCGRAFTDMLVEWGEALGKALAK